MPGKRMPTDVLEAQGRKHLTNEEKNIRREAEVAVPAATKANPPKWLRDERLRKEFRMLGKQLITAGLYTDLDADNLAYYITARAEYVAATETIARAIEAGDTKAAEAWSKIRDRFFKGARGCAASMGMTVSDRCRLVIPAGLQNPQSEEEPDEFTRRLRERQRAAGCK